MNQPKTVRVKPWGSGQGDFVIINEAELTEAHELYEEPGDAAGDDTPRRRGRPPKAISEE